MRVVDSLFFALAFLIDSIVCVPNLHPDPPYSVVKLTPEHVHGVMIECETHLLNSELKYLRTEMQYYPVEEDIYAVIQGNRIIGHTTFVRPNGAHMLYGIYGELPGWGGTIYYELEGEHEIQQPMERMFLEDAEYLGLNHRLPDNTIYHHFPQPQRRRVFYRRIDTGHLVNFGYVITPFRRP